MCGLCMQFRLCAAAGATQLHTSPTGLATCYFLADPTGEKACMYYKVQSGDSMATIGSVFGIPQLDIEVRL